MPAVLDRAAMAQRFDPEPNDARAATALLVPCPDDWLDAYSVAPLANRVGNDGPELIEPVE